MQAPRPDKAELLNKWNAEQQSAAATRFRDELVSLSRPELQVRAKASGVKANLASVDIIEQLLEQRAKPSAERSEDEIGELCNGVENLSLIQLSLAKLKQRAALLGIKDPPGHKGHKKTWIDAIMDRDHAPARSPNASPKAYALCIGVDEWTADADDFAQLCNDALRYQRVVKLNSDEGPTRIDVLKELTQLARELRMEDLLIVYYSGHGTRSSSEEFQFCTKGPNLSHSDFLKSIDQVKAKVIIIIDACHAGQFNAARKDKGPHDFDAGDLKAWMKARGRIVLAAARSTQEAPGSSAFTHSLIESARALLQSKTDVRPLTLFDEASKHMNRVYATAPKPVISGVEEFESFAIGPF